VVFCWLQSLLIAFSGSTLSSSSPVDIDTHGCTGIVLLHAATGLPRVLFVRVQPLVGYQKQVSSNTGTSLTADFAICVNYLVI